MNNIVKTNLPGFVKDKDSNVLIPSGLDDKIAQIKLNRKQHKIEKAAAGIINDLKAEISSLKARLTRLEGMNVQSSHSPTS